MVQKAEVPQAGLQASCPALPPAGGLQFCTRQGRAGTRLQGHMVAINGLLPGDPQRSQVDGQAPWPSHTERALQTQVGSPLFAGFFLLPISPRLGKQPPACPKDARARLMGLLID